MSRGSSATATKSVQSAKKRLQQYLKSLDTIPTDILEEEKPRLYSEIIAATPYKTGKLERSVRVSVAKDKRRPGLNASASAIAKNRYNYAGIQHERTDYHHPVKGQAHFISEPFDACVARIRKKMKERLKPPTR